MNIDFNKKVGARLDEIRKKHGLTWGVLTEVVADAPARTLVSIASGKKSLGLYEAVRISRVLGISLEDIYSCAEEDFGDIESVKDELLRQRELDNGNSTKSKGMLKYKPDFGVRLKNAISNSGLTVLKLSAGRVYQRGV